jgi:F-type H+-transporting ATPase subunit epsilon
MASDQKELTAGQAHGNKIELEIVTPKGRALKAVVDEVTAPSVAGEFGVLPGHLPLLAALQTGILSYKEGGETKRCAVGTGFAEAGPDKVAILTDRYIERDQIDPVLVRKELAEVQQKVAEASGTSAEAISDNPALIALIRDENWLAAQLELYGDPPAATMRPFETFGPVPGPEEEDVPQADAGTPGPDA